MLLLFLSYGKLQTHLTGSVVALGTDITLIIITLCLLRWKKRIRKGLLTAPAFFSAYLSSSPGIFSFLINLDSPPIMVADSHSPHFHIVNNDATYLPIFSERLIFMYFRVLPHKRKSEISLLASRHIVGMYSCLTSSGIRRCSHLQNPHCQFGQTQQSCIWFTYFCFEEQSTHNYAIIYNSLFSFDPLF